MDEKTREILDYFKHINAIPRCSKKEDSISTWLQSWAVKKQLPIKKDEAGNLVFTLNASKGYEQAPGIVFQGHMDMVCEKIPESDHDFTKDAIHLVYDGDWLRAKETTLGADNGIAIAIGLALAADAGINHPQMELLLTVDEESGLNGAKKLQSGFINGKILLNLDSETEGVFTVGCAGGRDTRVRYDLSFSNLPDNFQPYRLKVNGLQGGHSGIDIGKQRANANKILARALYRLQSLADIRLLSFTGGTVHNAIPRDATAIFACEPAAFKAVEKAVSDFEQILKIEYETVEKTLAISMSKSSSDKLDPLALASGDTIQAINMILALPHGVAGMSAIFKDLVETSNNLATVEIKNNRLDILTSQRSSLMTRLDEITAAVNATAGLAGATAQTENEYPPWQPNMNSALLQRCQEIYQKLFKREPVIEIIHAGLECAIIGATYPDMDMISFGPTIQDPHSPSERLYIPSIRNVWDFLVALLASYRP
jgi:dipeptidase D